MNYNNTFLVLSIEKFKITLFCHLPRLQLKKQRSYKTFQVLFLKIICFSSRQRTTLEYLYLEKEKKNPFERSYIKISYQDFKEDFLN